MSDWIYLDNAATTRCDPAIVAEMQPFFTEHFGNPSSRHALGLSASEALEQSRKKLSRALGVDPNWVVFTASGTEADATAIFGAMESSKASHLITTTIEHPAVLESAALLEQRGGKVTRVGVGASGVVSPDDIVQALQPDTRLVSVMHVNNEIGTIQPIKEIGQRLKEKAPHVLFHVDAVQGISGVPLDIEASKVDLLSLSGHKLHAPKGIGALLSRPTLRLTPRMVGGGQERGRRAGTENVAFARALAVACEVAVKERATKVPEIKALRDLLVDEVQKQLPEVTCNGDRAQWAPMHASLSFPKVKSEVLRNAAEARGVLASSGAACSSRKNEFSHVLKAIGHPADGVRGTLRLTLCRETTRPQIEQAVVAIVEAFRSLYRAR